MCDSWFGPRAHQPSRDRNLELIMQLLNIKSAEQVGILWFFSDLVGRGGIGGSEPLASRTLLSRFPDRLSSDSRLFQSCSCPL